jgi:hypothetical protein
VTPSAHVIDLAHPRDIAKHAARTVLTVSILPMALFYSVMSLSSVRMAVLATCAWYYAGLLVRLVRRRPIIGAAMLGAGLVTMRAVVMLWTGSTFLFFLQPVAGTVATATSFAVTALAGRPLLERLVHDFVPLPPALTDELRANRYFHYASLLWAAMYFVNAFGTVWLLTNASMGGFLLLKSVLSPMLTGSTIAVSYLLFRRTLARSGVHVRWTTRLAS